VRRQHEHLLKYSDIQDRFSEIIAGWHEHYQQIEPAFILLLRFFQDKLTISTEKFMDQARAIETFHRRTGKNRDVAAEEYSALIDKIVSNPLLTTTEMTWVKDKLRYGNEPSLRSRLKDMLKMYSNPVIQMFIPHVQTFVEEVVFNRNHYTHFSNDIGRTPLQGRLLQELADKIMMLLISGIFNLLQIPSTEYESGLRMQFSWRVTLPKENQ
jgi:hypothetical protein